jgi:hypothetical protein
VARLHVDPGDPTYGATFDDDWDGGPAAASSADVKVDVEVEPALWRPLSARTGLRSPDVVLLVDGVRRVDAWLWAEEDDGESFPALAASYAAGVVRCDLGRGAAEVAGALVGRGLFTASPTATDVVAGQIRYAVRRIDGTGEPSRLQAAVQGPLTALEVEVSGAARADGDLLVVDGPLRNRRQLPRAIGYIKTHHRRYLDPALITKAVTPLRAGERSPVFKLGPAWGNYSWYLRLPGAARGPWSGIVRVECSADLSEREAIDLADLSLVTLPRFASVPYKDPRAPRNLVPIAGLERRLRALLGDARLLHRTLTLATARAAGRR